MPLFGPPSVEKLQKKRDVDGLIGALTHKDVDVRRKAVNALRELADPAALESLIAALADGDKDVRTEVAWALGSFRDDRAVGHLIAALRDERGEVRSAAAQSLGALRAARALDPISALLLDGSWIERAMAAKALEDIGDGRAVDVLIRALADEEAIVRGHAASALGVLKDPRAVEPVVAALSKETVTDVPISTLGGQTVEQAMRGALEALGMPPDLIDERLEASRRHEAHEPIVADDQGAESGDRALLCPSCGAMLAERTPRFAYANCGDCGMKLEVHEYRVYRWPRE